MSELILTVGIPGSGKSTYALDWVLARPGRVRVNRDDLRFMMYGEYWGPDIDERLITDIQTELVIKALYKGNDVIVDNTNINRVHRLALIGTAKQHGFETRLLFFDIEVEEAIRRNFKRERQVPDTVIRDMHKRYMEIER